MTASVIGIVLLSFPLVRRNAGRNGLFPSRGFETDRLQPATLGLYYIRTEPLTGSQGSFRIYYPGVTAAERSVALSAGTVREIAGIDVHVPSVPTFRISGRVLDVSQHIASFYLVPRDPRILEIENPTAYPNEVAAASGEFRISGVLPETGF